MKNNLAILAMVAALITTQSSWSEESKTQSPKNENVVQKITNEAKKSRKKKVEMCAECGKPESECECHGHKDGESKKEDSSSSKKGS